MAFLTFEDQELEQGFASYFGWRCRRPTFLLSLVLTAIWTVRWIGAQAKTDIPFVKWVSYLFLAMAVMHSLNTIHIKRDPSVCRDEKRKATYLVLDAVACLFTILIHGGDMKKVAEEVFFPARLISSPFMVG